MEKRKLRNNIFLAVTILLALGAVAMLALPLLRLAFDAVTALLRSWGVLPGIEAVIVKTLQGLLLVLALVLPISLLITLWMYEYLHGLALGRVQRFLKGLSRVPAVLVGLLGNWLISGNAQAHGSIWSMAALLTVMCLPFMISRVDAALREQAVDSLLQLFSHNHRKTPSLFVSFWTPSACAEPPVACAPAPAGCAGAAGEPSDASAPACCAGP